MEKVVVESVMKNIEILTREYFELPSGTLIDNPDNLIYISEILIENTQYAVYFKNKTLKHFIERRSEDLCKRNNKEKALEIILKMLIDLETVLKYSTKIIKNESRESSFLIYKKFKEPGKTPLTAVLERQKTNMLIISYYFTKK